DVVVLAGDERGVAASLEAQVHALGARCVRATIDEVGRAVGDLAAGERVIVVLGDQYARGTDSASSDAAAHAERATARVLHLVQSLATSRRGAAAIELVVYEDGT